MVLSQGGKRGAVARVEPEPFAVRINLGLGDRIETGDRAAGVGDFQQVAGAGSKRAASSRDEPAILSNNISESPSPPSSRLKASSPVIAPRR
ncbi:MAG: hypothetical protein ABIN68_03570, partial [Sphingomicrobium sp.]